MHETTRHEVSISINTRGERGERERVAANSLFVGVLLVQNPVIIRPFFLLV